MAGVINWEEAMNQVGDDEEFLRELLGDLRTESDTQLNNITAMIQNPSQTPFHTIMRAAHVVKGAASNLMCEQLRVAATNLEASARQASEAGERAAPPQLQSTVQAHYTELQHATQNLRGYLQQIGV